MCKEYNRTKYMVRVRSMWINNWMGNIPYTTILKWSEKSTPDHIEWDASNHIIILCNNAPKLSTWVGVALYQYFGVSTEYVLHTIVSLILIVHFENWYSFITPKWNESATQICKVYMTTKRHIEYMNETRDSTDQCCKHIQIFKNSTSEGLSHQNA